MREQCISWVSEEAPRQSQPKKHQDSQLKRFAGDYVQKYDRLPGRKKSGAGSRLDETSRRWRFAGDHVQEYDAILGRQKCWINDIHVNSFAVVAR